MTKLVIPKKIENFKKSIFMKNAFAESLVHDVLDDADMELKKAKKSNEIYDTVDVDDRISVAQNHIRKAEMMVEAVHTDRSKDIKSVEVYSINFPSETEETPEGEYREFYSSIAAASMLIRLGKTESENVETVARNIFAAAMSCEGRSDRVDKNGNIRDRRHSAYRNNANETILWDFKHPEQLSEENERVYNEEHGNRKSENSYIEKDTKKFKKVKDYLNDISNYNGFMAILKIFPKSTKTINVSFVEKGFIKMFTFLEDLRSINSIIKNRIEKNLKSEEAEAAQRYIAATVYLQKIGKLPSYRGKELDI